MKKKEIIKELQERIIQLHKSENILFTQRNQHILKTRGLNRKLDDANVRIEALQDSYRDVVLKLTTACGKTCTDERAFETDSLYDEINQLKAENKGLKHNEKYLYMPMIDSYDKYVNELETRIKENKETILDFVDLLNDGKQKSKNSTNVVELVVKVSVDTSELNALVDSFAKVEEESLDMCIRDQYD